MTHKKHSKLQRKIFRLFTCRFRKKNLAILFVLLINCACLYMMHSIINEDYEFKPNKIKYVVVHIDLKGAPPKLSFLKSMISEVKALGANALLVEYEDMFPYENELIHLSRSEYYERSELKDFLIEANAIGVEIIPLIQTFGHMESVLKLEEFKHLRENSSSLDSICPSRLGTEILIGAMLRQVIEFHQNVAPLKHIHVGCDEVWQINKCEVCQKRNLQNFEIFFKHLDIVSNLVKNVSPNTTVLFWDDMMRSLSPSQLRGLKMKSKLEPVVWVYHTHLEVTHRPMYIYHLHFKNIWIASAFKGADGEEAAIPDYQKRTTNTLAWLDFVYGYIFGGESEIYEFKGIILTGWSRYKHFAPLCELLPVSYQSLVTSLVIINKYQNEVDIEKINEIKWVGDDETIFKENFINDYYRVVECQFNKCIINSTMIIYNSVRHYKDFIVSANKDLKMYAAIKNKNKYQWCYLLYNTLAFLEEDLKFNMRPYYTWEVQNEYAQRSVSLYKEIVKCLGSKEPPKRSSVAYLNLLL